MNLQGRKFYLFKIGLRPILNIKRQVSDKGGPKNFPVYSKLLTFFKCAQHAQKYASLMGQSTVQYTHRKHGPEVAEVSEQLLHRGLLRIHGEVLQHVLIQRLHIVVHDHQLAVLLPCNFAEAVRAVVKVNKHPSYIYLLNADVSTPCTWQQNDCIQSVVNCDADIKSSDIVR